MRVQEWSACHPTREKAVKDAESLVAWLGEKDPTRPVIIERPRHYVVQLWTFTDYELKKHKGLRERRYFTETEVKEVMKDGKARKDRH